MPLSLHAAFVPSALQMIDSTKGLVDRGESWCSEQGHDPAHVLSARIYEDMFPFTYQVKSVAVHTAGALAGVANGEWLTIWSNTLKAPFLSLTNLIQIRNTGFCWQSMIQWEQKAP